MRSRAYHLIPPAVSFSSTLGGRRDVKFYTFFPTYSASGPATLNEGASGTYNFFTDDTDGTYNFNTNPADRFIPATGTMVVTSGLGTFNLSAASNQIGSDTANVNVEFKNIANTVVLTTIVTSISDTSVVPVYSATGPASVDEGTSDTFTLSGVGIADDTFYYSVHPTGHFVEVNGSFSFTSESGSVVLSAAPDTTTEADTLVAIDFRTTSTSGTIVKTISSTVVDVAPWIVSGPSTVDEGNSTELYFLSTTQEQGTYYYSTHPTGEFVETTGSFTVNSSGVGTFILSAAPDGIVDGNILVAIDVRQTSVGGTIVDTISTTVVDTTGGGAPVADWVSFQEGVASYTGTTDTYVQSGGTGEGTDRGTAVTVITDKNPSDERFGLTKFASIEDVFTDNTAVTVTSASIELYVTAEGQGMELYTMLLSWTESTTWTSGEGAGTFDGGTGYMLSSLGSWPGDDGYQNDYITIVLDSQTVQDWINTPASNNGMFMIASHSVDGQQHSSKDDTTTAFRPKLQIAYTE